MSETTPGAPTEPSVTYWLERLKGGDTEAAEPLWNAYFAKLVKLARARLRSARGKDEEDVALSAFDSFFRGVEGGRFPRLGDRDDLWQVLFMLTIRKASDAARYEARKKRGGGLVVPLHPSLRAADEHGPDEVAAVTEQCARLLGLLDCGLRDVAVWKMEGFTNAEIAEKLGRSMPTVERKLAAIRAIWEREGAK